MDPLAMLRRYRERIDHVHVKDIHADGSWARPRTAGSISAPLFVLADTGYHGWIVLEDDSDNAHRHPDTARPCNGAFVRVMLLSLVDGGCASREPDPGRTAASEQFDGSS
jgi:inosose dehydratase